MKKSLDRIIRMVATHSTLECDMCKQTKVGGRWEYRNHQYIPNHIPKLLLICKKCIYREIYGSKQSRKAFKQNTLNKLNHNFGNKTPRLEK